MHHTKEESDDDSMKLGLKLPLRSAVLEKFKQAKANQDLLFSETELSILRSRYGVPEFQLRYCPALAKKPKENVTDSKQTLGKPKPDPFANPSPELLVGEVPQSKPSHFLVLNKYPVIENHFILATKLNKPQTNLLEEDDLGIAYACIKAWSQGAENGGVKQLYAFFNSGEHSGASQVHRHIQFLSVEDLGDESTKEWELLINRMTISVHPDLPLLHDPSIPFRHFAIALESQTSTSALYSKYLTLLKAAVSITETLEPSRVYNEDVKIDTNGETVISYNLAMTRNAMAICPRRLESSPVPEAGPESSVAINGTILAGTLMVKDEQEWEALRDHPLQLDDMLASIGHPAHIKPMI